MRWPALASMATGIGLLFPLASAIDARRPPPLELDETLLPARLLPLLAFGHRETAADLLEIQITNFVIRRIDKIGRPEADRLWTVYEAILSLDPQNADACWRGSVYLSSVANQPEAGILMLRRSLGEEDPEHPFPPGLPPREPVHPLHPRRWLLYHELAAIEFLMLRNRAKTEEERLHHTRRAGELWMLAGQQKDAPKWLIDAGRKLAQRGWSAREAFAYEVRLWEARTRSGDEAQRKEAQRRLQEARCALVREELQERVRLLRERGHPLERLGDLPGLETRAPDTLADLDPLGVGYVLVDGRVVAPAFEAARLQRDLEGRFLGWRAQHPDRVPTLEDLGVHKLSKYLEATIDAQGVRVRGRIP
ncbi:MAG: hypothetical protein D6731_13635 [Planctomycetota bacterium]|nr:MAG: hypothetical protein D6731_13635 [Planctomycetota bacterium]